MIDARCELYTRGDREALASVRRWTPKLILAVEDFIALRSR